MRADLPHPTTGEDIQVLFHEDEYETRDFWPRTISCVEITAVRSVETGAEIPISEPLRRQLESILEEREEA